MGCAEMIRSGTTCFNDMYYYPEESAEEVNNIGMRAIIGLMGRDNEGSLKTVNLTSYFSCRTNRSYQKEPIPFLS